MIKFLIIAIFIFPLLAFAYCPVCVIGSSVLVIAGYELGVKKIVMGLLIGGLAIVVGDWLNNLIKKKFFKGQNLLVIVLTFIISYLPVKNWIADYTYLTLNISNYQKFLLIDKSLLTGILGGILVFIAPYISKWITKKRGKPILLQRVIITLVLLIIFGLILQFLF
jgi:hypothetical protein